MEDFCFIRDIEHYQKLFDDPKELWERSLAELRDCDGLLIDVSDIPSGGRIIEVGMAYALSMPIIVIVKNPVEYKEFYDGVANIVIRYDSLSDVTEKLELMLREPQKMTSNAARR
ncbi:MAG: hypothetical protein WBB39_02280 [Candidatus Saccharimonadales bacterium]